MALAALDHARLIFGREPPPPDILRAARARGINDVLEKHEKDTSFWIEQLRAAAGDVTGAVEAAGDKTQAVASLTLFIDDLDAQLTQSRALIESIDLQVRRIVKQFADAPRTERQVVIDAFSRLKKSLAKSYDARVEMYYSFIALRAEFDPDSRGGPSFSTPDDLVAFLRASHR